MTATVLRTENSFLTAASADSSATPNIRSDSKISFTGQSDGYLGFLHTQSQSEDDLSFKIIY